MIDCHAHAFPSVAEATRKLPGPLSGILGAIATGVRRLPHVPVDIETVASARKRGPQMLHQAAEMALSLGILPQVALHASLDDLLASMSRHEIERTVVIAAPPTASNDWLLEATRPYGDRLVPVCTLPDLPRSISASGWLEAFDALAAKGARGFKIHPNVDGLPADHPAYQALFEAARRHGRFVILHTGCFTVPGYKSLAPADARSFVPLFEKFPDVRVCLAHMNRDEPEQAWALMKQHPQLWADTSWQPADNIRRAIDAVGAERILLGSDWPLLHPDLQGDALRQLERAASGEVRARIASSNAASFLGVA
jgi:predicted TIM-barrel fold metal-dependent hydrolase